MSNPSGGTPIPLGVYTQSVNDAPGVVASNVFLAVFNPTASPRVHVSLEAIVTAYAVGSSGTAASMTVQRFTGISGGTQIAPSQVGRFVTTMPDPQTLVFVNNPTLTGTGPRLANFPPPISNGVGTSSTSSQTVVPGASFTMLPGQGLAFFTPAGNLNEVWGIQYVWEEF